MAITKRQSILQKTVAVLTILCSVSGASVMAQHQQMVARYTRYEVKAGQLQQFRELLKNYVMYANSNDGSIMVEAHFEQGKPSVLWVIERWADKKELEKSDTNQQSKAVAVMAKKALVVPPKVIYVKDLYPISKEEWRRTAKADEDQLTIMLFVAAKTGTQQNFRDVYGVAMPQFRSEPGVVTYQLSEFNEDDSQFVTYEKFRSDEAFQYHLNFPPIQPVIDYLNVSIKNPPFQDNVHRLIEFAPLIREN